MKYEKLCNDILAVVPRENIQDAFCCVTRLRLIVKDKSAVDVAKLDHGNVPPALLDGVCLRHGPPFPSG